MSSRNSVFDALRTRVRNARLDLVETYGVSAVLAAVENYADGFADCTLQEIGTSDVSCWIKDIEETLKRTASPVVPPSIPDGKIEPGGTARVIEWAEPNLVSAPQPEAKGAPPPSSTKRRDDE